jgi:hypothetical protein
MIPSCDLDCGGIDFSPKFNYPPTKNFPSRSKSHQLSWTTLILPDSPLVHVPEPL